MLFDLEDEAGNVQPGFRYQTQFTPKFYVLSLKRNVNH